jgi:WD40 repeat protein
VGLPSGEVLCEYPQHEAAVTSAVFPGSDLVATGSRDGQVRFFRRDGEKLFSLPAPGPVRKLACSPDGSHLAVLVEGERFVRQWRLDLLAARFRLLHPSLSVSGLGASQPSTAPPWPPVRPVIAARPRGPHGLRREVFDCFFANKLKEGYDARIDLRWDGGGPVPDQVLGQGICSSVRWTGWIQAPVAGTYQLRLVGNGIARLWLDEALRIEWLSLDKGCEQEVQVVFAGRRLPLRLDFYLDAAQCMLQWKRPGSGVWEVVPAEAFYLDDVAPAPAGQEQSVRLQSYATSVRMAATLWVEGQKLGAAETLASYLPTPGAEDLRGFEWFYLRQSVSRPEVQELRAAERFIAAVRFSPDGRRLAALARGGIEIWDVLSSRSLQRLQEKSQAAPGASPRCCSDGLRFYPDGRRLISVPAYPGAATIKVWDIAAGRALAEWPGTGTQEPAAVSPDGQSVALAGLHPDDLTVQLWDVQSGRHRVIWRRSAQGQRGNVTSVAFSPAARLLAVAYFVGNEYKIDLLELPRGEVRATTLGNPYTFIFALAFSPDGATLASGAGKYATLYDTATGQPKEPLLVGPGIVSALAFSPDNRTLAAGWRPIYGAGLGEACSVSLWDVAGRRRLPRELRTGSGVNALTFSPDGQSLAVGCFDDRVQLWDTGVSSDVLVVPESSPREAWSVAFSPDGQTLAVGYDDERGGDRRTLQMWDLQTRRVRATLPGHASMVYAVTYTPDGRTVISAGHDHTVRLWDAATGKPQQTLSGHTDRVQCLACSPDGRTLASGGRDRTVRLWDLTTGNERLKLVGHTGNVHRVVFSPDGVTVASAGDDGTVRVWDAATGATVRLLPGTVTLSALAYAPDGRTLATADKTGLVRLWDPVTGVERARLQGHKGNVPALVYSPDGKTLASGGADRTVRLWQAATGQALLTLDGLPEYPHCLAFSLDGRTLAAALHDGTVKLWRGE